MWRETVIDITCKDYKMDAFDKCTYHYCESSVASEDEGLCSNVRQHNVLVIDDVTTNDSTLNEVLRSLRKLNKENDIRIFSLIGRKDLKID